MIEQWTEQYYAWRTLLGSEGGPGMEKVIYSSAKTLAALVQKGEVSATELVEGCLERIDEVNGKLNAAVQFCDDRARDEAKAADEAHAGGESLGPLHGVPMTIKDSLDTEGVISTGGTLGRADFVPDDDATVVKRLREAGAILIGKTNTPELTLHGETDNLVYGRTNNPYDLDRSPNGSSGGAAAIVSSGGVPFDLGSDTGGSIRAPAHVCGIAGIKPTSGRVSRTGHIVPWGMGALDALTTIGPMTRYVEDLDLVLRVIAGPDGRDPGLVPMSLLDSADVELKGLRAAVHSNNGNIEPTTETTAMVHAVASVLEEAGVQVEESVPEAIRQATRLYESIEYADGGAWIQRMLDAAGTKEVSEEIGRRQGTVEPVSSAELMKLLEELDDYRSDMLAYIQDYDIIICPTAAFPALPHGTWKLGGVYREYSHTSAYNLTGWPGGVVRAGTSPESLPIDVQIVARPWREDVVLAVLAHVEEQFGGWVMPPV